MAKHKKPTKEELDSKIQEAIETPVEEAPVEEPVEEVVEETPEEKPFIIPKVVEEEKVPEPEPVEEPELEVEPSAEVKEKLRVELEEKKQKLSASARENQKIYAKNRVINKALVEAEDIEEPTQEELQKEYRDWDVMSDFEKEIARETIISKRWRETIKLFD